MGDAAHAMVPFYGQGMNCVSNTANATVAGPIIDNTVAWCLSILTFMGIEATYCQYSIMNNVIYIYEANYMYWKFKTIMIEDEYV